MSTPFSIGSTCTSLALLLIALFTTRSTRSMIGAASLRLLQPARPARRPLLRCGAPATSRSPALRRCARRAAGLPPVTASSDPRLLRNPSERLVGIPDLNRLEDVAARRDDLLDAVAGLELEILHEAEQQRIGHRHRQQVLLETDGDADALERDVLRDQDDRGRIGRVLGEVDVREPELVARAPSRSAFRSRGSSARAPTPRRSPVRLCSTSASARSSSVMRPAWIRHSPIFLRNLGPRPKSRAGL